MKAAVSQVCSLESPFEKDFEEYAAGGCTAIELWVGKLDQYLAGHSAADVLSLLKQHQITAPVASFQGGLLASQGEFRREHWSSFSRRLEQLASLGVETLILA